MTDDEAPKYGVWQTRNPDGGIYRAWPPMIYKFPTGRLEIVWDTSTYNWWAPDPPRPWWRRAIARIRGKAAW